MVCNLHSSMDICRVGFCVWCLTLYIPILEWGYGFFHFGTIVVFGLCDFMCMFVFIIYVWNCDIAYDTGYYKSRALWVSCSVFNIIFTICDSCNTLINITKRLPTRETKKNTIKIEPEQFFFSYNITP